MAELDEYRVRRDSSGKISIDFKTRMDAGAMPTTWWDQNEYASANYGASELKELFGEKPFDFPKAKKLVQDCIRASDASTEVSNVIDFFAGSGTSGQAIIELTRSDEGKYHYVLVEMGDHFDTVLKPRIAKVVYSASWKDGKPAARHTGIHHCFKYMRLESYEDALANIRLQRPEEVGTLLDRESGLREQYLLRYMLDFEAGGSQSLLNLAQFEDPWNYRLMVGTGSVGETRAQTVDLVETFNWLLGLKVTRSFRRDSFHVVEGTNRAEEKVLVIWRRIRDLGEEDPAAIAKAREQSNRELETFFARQRYNTLDKEFDLVYVNGDNNLMNVSMAPDPETPPRYKVQLIEVAFHRLMFDDSDV